MLRSSGVEYSPPRAIRRVTIGAALTYIPICTGTIGTNRCISSSSPATLAFAPEPYGFCQGDCAAVTTSFIPMPFATAITSFPKIASRSRIKYLGASSHGNASRICCAVHVSVGALLKPLLYVLRQGIQPVVGELVAEGGGSVSGKP